MKGNTYHPVELLGQDAVSNNEAPTQNAQIVRYDLSARHAVKQGVHDGISTIVRFSMTGAVILGVSWLFLTEKEKKWLHDRFL